MTLKPLFTFFASLTLLSYFTVGVFANEQHTQRVKTAVVTYQDYQHPINSPGILSTKRQQKLSFKISGVIDHLVVDEGERVKKGQLIARLDHAEISAQVEQQRSVLANKQKHLKRVQALYKDKLITQEQLNAAETDVTVAEENLKISQFNLKHASIHAPNDGIVLRRLVEDNELVGPETPIYVISNLSKGYVFRVGLTDKQVVKVNLGDTATLHLDAYSDINFEATVSEIGVAANQQTGLFEVELTLNNNGLNLFTGLIGSASITPQFNQRLAFLPMESIVTAHDQSVTIYVVDTQGQVEQREVQLMLVANDRFAVSGGVASGEKVITEGAAFVRLEEPVAFAQEQE